MTARMSSRPSRAGNPGASSIRAEEPGRSLTGFWMKKPPFAMFCY
jgi:hypothetical protein